MLIINGTKEPQKQNEKKKNSWHSDEHVQKHAQKRQRPLRTRCAMRKGRVADQTTWSVAQTRASCGETRRQRRARVNYSRHAPRSIPRGDLTSSDRWQVDGEPGSPTSAARSRKKNFSLYGPSKRRHAHAFHAPGMHQFASSADDNSSSLVPRLQFVPEIARHRWGWR